MRCESVDKLLRDLEALQNKTGEPRDIALWQAGVYARDFLARRHWTTNAAGNRCRYTEPDFEDDMQDVLAYVLKQYAAGNYDPKYGPGTWGALKAKSAIRHKRESEQAAKRAPLPWEVTEADWRKLAESNGWQFADGCSATAPGHVSYDGDDDPYTPEQINEFNLSRGR